MSSTTVAPRRRGLALLIAAAVLAALALAWWATRTPSRQDVGPPRQTIPVRVAEAALEPLTVRIRALGTVTPLNTVTVRSRVEGELVRLAFEEGQQVEAGQLLAEIDARPYQVQLAQAEGAREQNLAELENAEVELARYRDLQARQYVSAQELSAQEARVRQLQGRRDSDRAAVDEARLQLQYTRITAPAAGRIGLRGVDQGNLVRANDENPLATITQLRPISVLFTIPENALPQVLEAVRGRSDLPVEAWDRDERRQLATGSLVSLDNVIDASTGTLRLRASFANEDESLFPNQFVNVRLQVSRQEALVIPDAAVQFGASGTFVYVVGDDDTTSLRPVVLGASDGSRVAVAEGLAPGERVVLEGLDRLREGTRVEVVADPPGAAPAAAGT